MSFLRRHAALVAATFCAACAGSSAAAPPDVGAAGHAGGLGGQTAAGNDSGGNANAGSAGKNPAGAAGNTNAGAAGKTNGGSAGNANAGSTSGGTGGSATCPPGPTAPTSFIRVNQVGYRGSDAKRALLLTNAAASGTFRVRNAACDVVFEGPIGADRGAWSKSFAHVYELDFSSVTATGTDTVETGDLQAISPVFAIGDGPSLYGKLVVNAIEFYRVQRDGKAVVETALDRKASHKADETATTYEPPTYSKDDVLTSDLVKVDGPTVDKSGGWFDAGDYLKFVQTTSYAEAAMLLAARDEGAQFTANGADVKSEARVGLDWLRKAWDDDSATLRYQVGIGDGSDDLGISGDHDFWRLPEADDKLDVAVGDAAYYVRYRPALRLTAPGGPISPNLAGRLAASFALASVVYRADDGPLADACLAAAEHVYALADPAKKPTLVTASPYDYYPETAWRDDLELGSAEIALALQAVGGAAPATLPQADPSFYLAESATWAQRYIASDENGADSLNLYDVSALAHAELYRALVAAGSPTTLDVTPDDLVQAVKSQLDAAAAIENTDPFHLGVSIDNGDLAPHALGIAVTAALYEDMSQDPSQRALGTAQRDFVLGANAWGSSFVVGAGTTFPRCVHHQIANINGSLDGSAPILLGAVVDGATAPSDLDGLDSDSQDGQRACPPAGGDTFATFASKSSAYRDDVRDYPSTEPALDYAALTLLLFPRQ